MGIHTPVFVFCCVLLLLLFLLPVATYLWTRKLRNEYYKEGESTEVFLLVGLQMAQHKGRWEVFKYAIVESLIDEFHARWYFFGIFMMTAVRSCDAWESRWSRGH